MGALDNLSVLKIYVQHLMLLSLKWKYLFESNESYQSFGYIINPTLGQVFFITIKCIKLDYLDLDHYQYSYNFM